MNRPLSITLWASSIGAALSGLGYAGLARFVPTEDPFATYGHPAEPWLRDLHGLAGPALVFAAGWALGSHVLPRWSGGRGKRGGVVLLGLLGISMLAGAWLPLAVEPAWRSALGWVHGLAGAAYVAILPLHAVLCRRAARELENPWPGSEPSTRTTPTASSLRSTAPTQTRPAAGSITS